MNKKYSRTYFEERDTLIPHLAQTIAAYAKKNKLKTILDVGCGTGLLVNFLNTNRLQALGCDSSIEAIKASQKNDSQKNIILASATSLPFKANSFDLVTSISVIEHLTKNEALEFIKESKRVLNKNGFIFLVTPNFATPLRILFGKKWFAYQDPTHINFFTPKSLSNLLIKNGFKNPKTRFMIPYSSEIDSQFPMFAKKMPLIFKKILVYLLFNSPLYTIRDSFWISAQKND